MFTLSWVPRNSLNLSHHWHILLFQYCLRMSDFIARTEAWIENSALQIRSTRKEVLIDEGFILESFECMLDQGAVRENICAVMHRVVYAPVFGALLLLCRWAGQRPRQRANLQKQSSLGQHFVGHFVTHLAAFGRSHPVISWKGIGQLKAYSALQQSGVMFHREPGAKTLVAWTASCLKFESTSSFQRSHGRCDLDDGEAGGNLDCLLHPLFIDHDRGPHCERQALLGHLRMLHVKFKKIHIPRLEVLRHRMTLYLIDQVTCGRNVHSDGWTVFVGLNF